MKRQKNAAPVVTDVDKRVTNGKEISEENRYLPPAPVGITTEARDVQMQVEPQHRTAKEKARHGGERHSKARSTATQNSLEEDRPGSAGRSGAVTVLCDADPNQLSVTLDLRMSQGSQQCHPGIQRDPDRLHLRPQRSCQRV